MPENFNAYDEYAVWKEWNKGSWGQFSRKKGREFRKLVGTAISGCRLLEVGFGGGAFLAWAQNSGALVVGVERQRELLEIALGKDFAVFSGLGEVPQGLKFDVIVAFDVLEHLSVSEIRAFFLFASERLTTQGRLVVKVPNAACPFSLGMQHGDVTHVTPITVASITQLMSSYGFSILKVRPHVAPLPGGFAGFRALLQRSGRKIYSLMAGFLWDLSEENFYQCLVIDIKRHG